MRPRDNPHRCQKTRSAFWSRWVAKNCPRCHPPQAFTDQHKKTPAQVALNWLVAQGVVPIPGAKNAQQAQQNAEALGWSLNPEDVADLEKVSRPWLE
uniref:Aldo/keto reductase n=1 Tax=Desertifilum tharense IPPAS B-1220 TaxID=1781255 RepID=A0ACD5H1Q2_9CYAN